MLSEILFAVALVATASQEPKLGDFTIAPEQLENESVAYQTIPRLPLIPDKILPPKRKEESLGIELNVKSAAVVDTRSGTILWEKNAHQKLPIASITKLMTTSVFFDSSPNLDNLKTLEAQENDVGGAKFSTGQGTQLTLRNTLFITLNGSANNTARSLAHATGMNDEDFVKAMNAKAVTLNMAESAFADPTGLNPKNVSTAEDLLKLASYIFQREEVRQATSIPSYTFIIPNTEEERTVKGTNKFLIHSFLNETPYKIVAAKTGYTEEAGFCLIQETSYEGKGSVIAVVLGANDEQSRAQEMKKLTNWIFENYVWQNESSKR